MTEVPVYACSDKNLLWVGIYSRELQQADEIAAKLPKPLTMAEGEALWGRVLEFIKARMAPKYIIWDKPDAKGYYAVIDADTGEITAYKAKFYAQIPLWECVEILPQ